MKVLSTTGRPNEIYIFYLDFNTQEMWYRFVIFSLQMFLFYTLRRITSRIFFYNIIYIKQLYMTWSVSELSIKVVLPIHKLQTRSKIHGPLFSYFA